jgi:hypothetical protein
MRTLPSILQRRKALVWRWLEYSEPAPEMDKPAMGGQRLTPPAFGSRSVGK